MNRWNVLRAYIELKALRPVALNEEGLISICSIGGFAGIAKDGRDFVFDWESYAISIQKDPNDFRMDCELRDFDFDFYEGSNIDDASIPLEEFTPELIKDMSLYELMYEAFEVDESDDLIPMELVSFVISFYDNETDETVYVELSDEQIQAFNESSYPAYK